MSYLAQHNPGVRPEWQENWRRLVDGVSPANLAELAGTLVGRFNWESRAAAATAWNRTTTPG